MKLYFSIWGYSDPTRVGYDTVGASYYLEKPSTFSGIGSTQVYEIDIPDTFTLEQAKELGKSAVKLMEKTNYYDPRLAVRKILNGEE